MANGKLGGVDLGASSEALLYQPASGVTATVNVTFANRNSSSVKVRLAHSASGDSGGTPDDWLVYDGEVAANGFLQVTGLVVAQEQKLFVTSNTVSVTATAHGFEE